MLRYLFVVVSVSISALGAVSFLHENPDVIDTAATVYKDRVESQSARKSAARSAEVKSRTQPGSWSGTVRLQANAGGHFVSQFSLNSRQVTGVVDTGASMIAMNRSEARKVGINVAPHEFVYKVNTANGSTMAARAIVREVRIGSIRVRDVEAMILEDDALNIVLIGMSFLNRLRNFEFSEGRLVLTL